MTEQDDAFIGELAGQVIACVQMRWEPQHGDMRKAVKQILGIALSRYRDAEQAPEPPSGVEQPQLIAVLKEFEEADVNHGLAQERLKAANDRAERLYVQWKDGPTSELADRRRENLDECLRLADVAAQALRRKLSARKAITSTLIDAALHPPQRPVQPETKEKG